MYVYVEWTDPLGVRREIVHCNHYSEQNDGIKMSFFEPARNCVETIIEWKEYHIKTHDDS